MSFEKTSENAEQLGRQAQPGTEPNISFYQFLAQNRSAPGEVGVNCERIWSNSHWNPVLIPLERTSNLRVL